MSAGTKNTAFQSFGFLLENFPQTKILALNPLSQVNLPHADFNIVLDGSEQWLTAVVSTSG
jgi:hypothetical protein